MPTTRGPKAKTDRMEKNDRGEKSEKGESRKQRSKKEVDDVGEAEKGGSCSGPELMSVKHADLPHCVDCGKKVLWTQAGLQCDLCGFWHHAACSL